MLCVLILYHLPPAAATTISYLPCEQPLCSRLTLPLLAGDWRINYQCFTFGACLMLDCRLDCPRSFGDVGLDPYCYICQFAACM